MSSSVTHKHSSGFWKYKYALRNLILKDFKVRYRNMSLGILWSILNPLIMLGVLVFVFTQLLGRGKDVPYFPIQVLTGIIIFNFFSNSLQAATACILQNASIIKKMIFPRQIIPVSIVFSQLIHLAIQLFVLAIFITFYKVPITWSYLWLPVVFVVLTIFLLGISLIFATLNVYFRDAQYLVQSSLTILFWFTPIFYTLKVAHHNLTLKFSTEIYFVYLLNPLAGCVNAARHAILWNSPPDTIAFGMASIASVATFIIGILVFGRYQKNFADHI